MRFCKSLAALTRFEVVAVLCIWSLLAVVLVVSVAHRAAARSKRIRCANNLKQIGLAFKTWALDHGDQMPMQAVSRRTMSLGDTECWPFFECFQVISNELDPELLICPADSRRPAVNLTSLSNSNLSYFLGLDAVDTNPQMFLTGDRNLTNGPLPPDRVLVLYTNYSIGWTRELHRFQGNIGLADGSVQQYSIARLRQILRSEANGNRLAMP